MEGPASMIDRKLEDESRQLVRESEKDRFQLVSVTDAARFLGYKTNRPITKLIRSKVLPIYTLPDSGRSRVKVSDLRKLAKPTKPSVEIPSS